MMQFGQPGAQYTQGNRLTRLLGGQDLEGLNDGSIPGGIAYALARGFQGYQDERDSRQQSAAQQALVQGLQGGDYSGAIQALQGLQGNPHAEGRLTQLLLAQAGQQQEQAQREAQWTREDERFGQRMAAQDQRWQQQFQAEQTARQQAAAADRAFRERMFGMEQAANQPQGAFAGNAMDAQARNIILSADPSSPEYAAAYSYLSSPQTSFQNGRMVTESPDMSWAAPPVQMQPPRTQPQAPLASGGMSQAPQRQPAYFAPGQQPMQAPGRPPPGQQIAPGVTVTPIADPEEAEQAAAADVTKAMTGSIVLQDINRALDSLAEGSGFSTGFPGQVLSNVGGTGAYDLDALLLTVASNLSFDRLQRMREESPTGGALGNVSNFEIQNLAATAGNLSVAQTSEQLRENLQRLQARYEDFLTKLGYPTDTPIDQVPRRQSGIPPQARPSGGQMARNAPSAPPAGVDPQDWQYMTPEERALFQ